MFSLTITISRCNVGKYLQHIVYYGLSDDNLLQGVALPVDIIKRNGQKEELIFSKLKKVIDFACVGYSDCNPLELETALLPYFRNNITTKEIQRTLTQVAVEKTSIEEPNWQYVAAKLLVYDLYKESAINRKYGYFGTPATLKASLRSSAGDFTA